MISYERFLEWAEKRFGDVKASSKEIRINSIFTEDYKYHMSCNPSGGKKNLPYGVYHCWKTNKGGSLVSLVMLVDKCSFDEALDTLDAIDLNFENLKDQVDNLFNTKKEIKEIIKTIELPNYTYKITELNDNNLWRTDSEIYLNNRKIPYDEFYICTNGDYKNRIIIPYFDENGVMIYWNSRLMIENKKSPKYLGPDKACGIGKSDVVYFPRHYKNNKNLKLYITEGEFDAYSLYLSGPASCALGGKSIEEKQIEMIRGFIPVLCFDTDNKKIDAGGDAMIKIGEMLKSKGFDKIYYVRPPLKYKDWNKMLVETNERIVNYYVIKNEIEFTDSTKIELKLMTF